MFRVWGFCTCYPGPEHMQNYSLLGLSGAGTAFHRAFTRFHRVLVGSIHKVFIRVDMVSVVFPDFRVC